MPNLTILYDICRNNTVVCLFCLFNQLCTLQLDYKLFNDNINIINTQHTYGGTITNI